MKFVEVGRLVVDLDQIVCLEKLSNIYGEPVVSFSNKDHAVINDHEYNLLKALLVGKENVEVLDDAGYGEAVYIMCRVKKLLARGGFHQARHLIIDFLGDDCPE